MRRPKPPAESIEGYRWVAVHDVDWRVLSSAERNSKYGRRCRAWRAHPPGQRPPAVAELNRGRWARYPKVYYRTSWWAYCAEHLYGHWIEDGQVMGWRRRPA